MSREPLDRGTAERAPAPPNDASAEPRRAGASVLDPAELARIAKLEIAAQHVVEGFLRGHHRSAMRGSSLEFAEHRAYAPGDDLRRLDWRAYARTGRPWVKQFEDETNLRAILALDHSASMGFRGQGVEKLAYGRVLIASLAWLLLGERDAPGLATFAADVTRWIPPEATAANLARLFEGLEATSAEGPGDPGAVLARLAERAPRRSLVIVASDLLGEPESILNGLARLRGRGCDVRVLHIVDPHELDPPFSGPVRFVDAENPTLEVRLDPREARAAYRARFDAHREALRRGCAALEVIHTEAMTTAPFDRTLARHLAVR